MKNSEDPGFSASVDNTLRDLQNSSYPTKAEYYSFELFLPSIRGFAISLFVFLLTKYNTISFLGFLVQRFNNLQRAKLLTSLAQYDKDYFQIWLTAAGYGVLCVWFEPIRNWQIF